MIVGESGGFIGLDVVFFDVVFGLRPLVAVDFGDDVFGQRGRETFHAKLFIAVSLVEADADGDDDRQKRKNRQNARHQRYLGAQFEISGIFANLFF